MKMCMTFCASSKRANTSDSAKTLTVVWPHGAPSQMQPSLQALKTSGPILDRCFLSSQGSGDLQVTEAA